MTLRIVATGILLGGLVWFTGCENVPRHTIPEAYPSRGPTGVRMGFTYQRNFDPGSSLPYWDASDFWENAYGGSIEIPIDVDPFWGGFFGIGYEHMPGEKDTVKLPDGSKRPAEMDSINLLPLYVGIIGRLPFWLDREKWKETEESLWLPEPPVGFAPYVRGSFGGAILLNSPDIVHKDTGEDYRAFDYQIFPFLEAAIGLEYRHKWIGYWVQGGYRYYILPDRDSGGFGGSRRMGRLGGVRAMAGISLYFW